jgi:fucose 4-O-acetylase-like acetyltransferase
MRSHHDNPDASKYLPQMGLSPKRGEMMLHKPEVRDQAVARPVRIVALDRARTVITLLVVLHHSVISYTYFGHGDRMRWLGFDLVVPFNDSFFMACMFFISGLFVRDSLARRGSAEFRGRRAWRLGVPFLISIFAVMPIASDFCALSSRRD